MKRFNPHDLAYVVVYEYVGGRQVRRLKTVIVHSESKYSDDSENPLYNCQFVSDNYAVRSFLDSDLTPVSGRFNGDIQEPVNQLAGFLHSRAVEKGWWRKPVEFGDVIANCHAELSEAWEEYRNHHSTVERYTEEDGKPCGIPAELADTIIRILDMCAADGIDLQDVILEKAEYNLTRSDRHGGKRA